MTINILRLQAANMAVVIGGREQFHRQLFRVLGPFQRIDIQFDHFLAQHHPLAGSESFTPFLGTEIFGFQIRLRQQVLLEGDVQTGMPVFHLAPADPELFRAERFPVFGADISTTGYYGFPLHGGVVKIANHGPGRAMHPSSTTARQVTDEEIVALRAFLADTFPALADAPLAQTRVCVYCDTRDGHFWIDRDPARPRLVVATGGSGHAFKFAPILGDLIADAALGRPHPKFRWRPEAAPAKSDEAARAYTPDR